MWNPDNGHVGPARSSGVVPILAFKCIHLSIHQSTSSASVCFLTPLTATSFEHDRDPDPVPDEQPSIQGVWLEDELPRMCILQQLLRHCLKLEEMLQCPCGFDVAP